MMKKHFFIYLFISLIAVSVSWSLSTPKYLSVPHWNDCTHTIKKGMAKFVCLPAKKPINCPYRSWKELTREHLIEVCEKNSKNI
jgi:hypothetical protein